MITNACMHGLTVELIEENEVIYHQDFHTETIIVIPDIHSNIHWFLLPCKVCCGVYG